MKPVAQATQDPLSRGEYHGHLLRKSKKILTAFNVLTKFYSYPILKFNSDRNIYLIILLVPKLQLGNVITLNGFPSWSLGTRGKGGFGC